MSTHNCHTPRRRKYSTYFERLVCNLQGSKIEGTPYHVGSKTSGDARSYQFRNLDDDAINLCDSTDCHIARKRIAKVLSPKDLDTLYLIHVANWQINEVAKHRGCDRTTIWRHNKRIIEKLASDPVLRHEVGA